MKQDVGQKQGHAQREVQETSLPIQTSTKQNVSVCEIFFVKML